MEVTKQSPQLNDKHYFPYHSSQRDIINMIEQYSNTNVITKFQFQNKWFNGCYVTINHKNILAHTIGTDEIQIFSKYFNQQQIYTSIVSHIIIFGQYVHHQKTFINMASYNFYLLFVQRKKFILLLIIDLKINPKKHYL